MSLERPTPARQLMKPFLEAVTPEPASLRALASKVTSTPNLFAGYAELLETIESKTNCPDDVRHLLQLFSYGTWKDYTNAAAPPTSPTTVKLTEAQSFKLKQLTVLSLLPHHRSVLPYAVVQDAIPNAAVESLLISLLYAGALVGRLCQKQERLEWTECRVSRDVISVDHLIQQVRHWKSVTAQAQTQLAHQQAVWDEAQRKDEDYWDRVSGSTAASLSSQPSSILEQAAFGVAHQASRRPKRSRGGLAGPLQRPYALPSATL